MVGLIDRALMAKSKEEEISEIRTTVNALMSEKPLFTW
jgi:hypothetical protein